MSKIKILFGGEASTHFMIHFQALGIVEAPLKLMTPITMFLMLEKVSFGIDCPCIENDEIIEHYLSVEFYDLVLQKYHGLHMQMMSIWGCLL